MLLLKKILVRMNLNFFEDIEKNVIGVDEVGRGALCGPVVSSAVLLNKNVLNHDLSKEIDDSKKLNEKKRYLLSNFIKKNSIFTFGVSMISMTSDRSPPILKELLTNRTVVVGRVLLGPPRFLH